MNNISNKKFFKNYGIFLLILIISFLVLIYLTILSRNFWKDNLKESITTVLEENQPEKWEIGNFIDLDVPLSSSSAAYEVKNLKTKKEGKVVIIRVITFFGPASAVFIYHDEENIEFIGYSNIHGRISAQLKSHNSDARINYWKKQVREIFK